MYVIVLHYKVGIDVIDRWRPAHLGWLQKYYDAGYFVASGRQNPLVGGVILSRQMPRTELDKLLAEDPFIENDLADTIVIEFLPHMTAPGFESLKN